MSGALGRLWRHNRWLLVGFLAAAAVTLALVVRLAVSAVYWSQHRDIEIRPWMTVGYVARSYGVERGALAEALEVSAAPGRRLTLAEIAADRGVPVAEVEARLLAVIAAERAAAPAP